MKRLLAALLLATVATGCAHANPGAAVIANGALAARSAAVAMPVRYAEVTNGHKDLLFRGGLPDDGQLKALLVTGVSSKQAGKKVKIATMVNLLSPDGADGPAIEHEKAFCEAHGVTFINIALPMAAPPKAMTQTWFDAVRAARAAHTAVYVHCKHGRDRTGSMVAAYREEEDGYTAQQALDEMEAAPFNYDPQPYPWITQFVLAFKPF